MRLSRTPAAIRAAAPCLGQHNAEVLSEVLGLGADEIRDLEKKGLLVERPPPGATSRGVKKKDEVVPPRNVE